jgi:hypothetical protein
MLELVLLASSVEERRRNQAYNDVRHWDPP